MFTRWVWDGVYTTEQATRGAALYRTQCADCHGAELQGRSDYPQPPPLPPGTNTFYRSGSPALTGERFISKWTDLSVNDLYERIRISMPQNAPGSLSRQQNADILAFILRENRYPAGDQELGLVKASLDLIRIGR